MTTTNILVYFESIFILYIQDASFELLTNELKFKDNIRLNFIEMLKNPF